MSEWKINLEAGPFKGSKRGLPIVVRREPEWRIVRPLFDDSESVREWIYNTEAEADEALGRMNDLDCAKQWRYKEIPASPWMAPK